MTYPKFIIFLAATLLAMDFQSVSAIGKGRSYVEMLTSNVQNLMSRGPFFYKLCEYVDGNAYNGGVIFGKFSGINYYIEFDRENGNILQIVPYRRKDNVISLGPHWGGDGAGQLIRKFLLDNRRLLDGMWDYSEKPLTATELTAKELSKCRAPSL